MITLYHGSNHIIEKPFYGTGNPRNDYGLAFYCTEHIELAREWSVSDEEDGYANRYSFDENGLSILNLHDGRHNILNWLAILLENRTFKIKSPLILERRDYFLHTFLVPYKKYDVIKGYRADDSYFAFADLFLNNGLPLDALAQVMHLGELGEQYAIRSKKAFGRITFEGYETVEKDIYYPLKKSRDERARSSYQNIKKDSLDGIYLMDILREEWRNDDERIQRIIY